MGLVAALTGPVSTLLTDIVDRAFPDKVAQEKERQEFLLKAQTLDNQLAAAQVAVNQVEAASSNIFVSGWRPFIGWVCGAAFAYKFIVQPFLIFALVAIGSKFDYEDLPVLDWGEMSTILIGLLGLGTMKTVEKVKGV